ncbi:MAG: hypothetical protein ACI4PQ_07265 [Butyricicoccaceae bacterium]
MKRLSALALAAVLTMSVLAGCGTNNNGTNGTTGNVDNNGSGYTQNDGYVDNNGNTVTGDTDTGYDSDGDGILGNDPVGNAVDDITGNNGTTTNDNNANVNNNGTNTNANNNVNNANR